MSSTAGRAAGMGRAGRGPSAASGGSAARLGGALLCAAALLAGCSGGGAGAAGPTGPTASGTGGSSASATAAAPTSGGIPDLSGEEIASVHDVPERVSGDGVVELGEPEAPVVLDAYEDFLCDACAQLSRIYDEDVYSAISRGELAMRYHPIVLLDGKSASGDYSTRAAAAALCVAGDTAGGETADGNTAGDGSGSGGTPDGDTADGGPYSRFRNALFRENVQPSEGGRSDHDDAALAHIAAQVGAGEAAQQCIRDGARVPQAASGAAAARAALAKLSGGKVITPSVYHGRTEVPITKSGWLRTVLGQR